MKKVIIIGVIALTAIGFAACSKCKTCTAYYKADNTVYYEDHYCGKALLLNTWEDSFKTSYDYGDKYVECVVD